MSQTLVEATGRSEMHDGRSFRDIMGRFPTGVVLITATTASGPVGMAVNSFTSVSLDPPMVSFCPMSTSETWARIRATDSFAISILRGHHENVSRLFAQRGANKFGSHAWVNSPAGHPILKDSLGWIDASVLNVQSAGDHDLVIASADEWSDAREGSPLVFFTGRYAALESVS
jgi:3-hydroxy-9,10-secoandrosta-1,3,5(10)-triene-9,17-dione monooxygenase reductase component